VYHFALLKSQKGALLMKAQYKLLSPLLLLVLLGLGAACQRAGQVLGPKDEGGIYLIIGLRNANTEQPAQVLAQTMAVMQKRCERLNIYCKLERYDEAKSNLIKLRFSSPEDPERIKSILLSEGLELRAVVSPPGPAPVQTYPARAEAAEAAGAKGDVITYAEQDGPGKFIIVESAPIITGPDIREAGIDNVTGRADSYQINFKLTPAAAERFGAWTGANIDRYLAVVLSGRVRSVAAIKGQIFDSGQITGRFTKAEAEDAALLMMSGNLPAPVQALEEGFYKP
jgi:preprotein translocase subunit SecD